ncbi:hypothetical protein C6Q22_21165 [Burkholderia multivorans]|nr:hypothetical protein C6Q22_21165 [Burkholderia multivorans]PRG67361.1 hypothetical protein C6T69_18880 [Burkholderia multivorans]RSB78133.1 hypothetical protein EGT33_07155 [Burkholderia multivorans]
MAGGHRLFAVMHSGRGADARRRRIGLFCLGGQLRSHASGAWIRNGEYTKTTLQNLSVFFTDGASRIASRRLRPRRTSNMRTERMIAGIGVAVSSDEYPRGRC